MNTFEIYAANIKKFRTAKKMSQANLAEKIGLSVKFISDLETGRSLGSLETLVAIANAVEIEPFELLMPENQNLTYDNRKTRQLLATMKNMYSEFVNSLEGFLSEK